MFEDVRDFLNSIHLNPEYLVPDGEVHRFNVGLNDRRKCGWYVLRNFKTRDSEESVNFCCAGDWRLGKTHRFTTDKVTFAEDDRAYIKKQIKAAEKKERAERAKLHEEVSLEVTKRWESLSKTGASDYLTYKKIDRVRNLGIRFTDNGSIVIPITDIDGKIWSLQDIDKLGNKDFESGGRVKGCFHSIGNLDIADTIIICEGFSTGASIHLAMDLPVVCAFSTTNLENVTREISAAYPGKKFLICGDNDGIKHVDKNPGAEFAEKAAKICSGEFVIPDFKIENYKSKPSDFNDLHCLEDLDQVRKQISKVEKKTRAVYVMSLGYYGDSYFFTSSDNPQIAEIRSFTKASLYALVPREYWERRFPSRAGELKFDLDEATSVLMSECRRRGRFEFQNVRGSGVWLDDGRTVVNMGNYLIVDGKLVGSNQLKSKFFYTLGKNIDRIPQIPMSLEDAKLLPKICASFKWKRKSDSILLAGALANARICGAINVRSHTWITGGAQTGKTTLLHNLVNPVLGSAKLNVQGATTEAGVRQALGNDAIPVLFDEFETTGRGSDENLARLIELMRAAWSDSEALILKGSAGGTASGYIPRFSAIVSSIRTKLINDADKGRFSVIELAPHGNDAEHYAKLQKMLEHVTKDYCDQLFARMLYMLPVTLKNFRVFKKALAMKADTRFGDQYGMLLAGYSSLVKDDEMTPAEAAILIEEIDLNFEVEQSKNADHFDALHKILTTEIQVDFKDGSRRMTIGSAIEEEYKHRKNPMHGESTNQALLNIGIKVDDEHIDIAVTHATLEAKVFRGTRWSDAWSNSLARISGAARDKTARFGGKPQRSIRIPIEHFVE